MTVMLLIDDCRQSLAKIKDGTFQTCVTSPPYFGLRDYGHDGQIGLEPTPDEFVAAMVEVFREVKRVLRDDGTLWLNLGDSYCSTAPGTMGDPINQRGIFAGVSDRRAEGSRKFRPKTPEGLKPKDLIGIPWRVAFALQADGWYLRQDIIWHKPNPMPESVTDRCTKAHEYVFLLSKSPRYYFDSEAIKEDTVKADRKQSVRAQELAEQHGLTDAHIEAIRAVGITDVGKARVTQDGTGRNDPDVQALADEAKVALGGYYREFLIAEKRNKRDVWTVATKPFKGAHFATFPPDLIEPCILAGSPVGGLVLDPFGGAGTTALVAERTGRNSVLCELNFHYAALMCQRLGNCFGWFPEVLL